MTATSLFQFEQVSYKVAGITILEDISFSLERGDFLSLLGASGAGKSTLLRLFNLLLSPTEGHILYRGQPPEADIRALRQNVGFLFQTPAIFNGSVRENLLIAGRWDLQIAQILDHELKGVLDQVELFNLPLSKNARDLSGGEQQRLALARTLLNKPQVLLLDEPTSNLDPKLSISIMDLVKKLQDELKLTVVAVSHDHRLMRKYARRVIVLATGRIVAMGSFAELDALDAFMIGGLEKDEVPRET